MIGKAKASVCSYFYTEYQAEKYDEVFWVTTFTGGEKPIDKLREDALQLLVHNRVILAESQKRGFLSDTHFTALEKMATEENQKRAAAVKNGEPVYGPVSLSMGEYYDYLLSNLSIRLKDALYAEKTPDEAALRAFYEEIRGEMFKDKGKTDYMEYRLPYTAADRTVQKEKAEDLIDRLRAGVPFTQAGRELGMEAQEQTLDWNLTRTVAQIPALAQALADLQPAEFTGVVEENAAFTVAICRSRVEQTIPAFDDVREKVEQLAAQRLLEDYLAERADEYDEIIGDIPNEWLLVFLDL